MAFAEIDEKLLVRAYQAGDERAFDAIVRTQHQALYAHALRRLNQHEAAEDAVQDTLLRAYRALPNLDGDLALRAWLHRILTNVCHDEGNRRRRQQGLVEKVGALPEVLAEDPVDEAVLHETVQIMSEALRELPDTYREALVLRYVDGLSFREVAEASGITEENARARVQRGKSALHKIMSRLAVMLAFVIPGLKRTQAVATTDQAAASSGLSDHTLNLATQLTSHVMTSAPTVSRFAEISTSMSGGKSALAAAAMTAVAAVSVPAAVHTIHDATKTERPPAAVAAPAQDSPREAAPTGAGAAKVAGGGQELPPTTSSTSSTLPPSQTHPFEVAAGTVATPSSLPRKSEPTNPTTSTSAPAPKGAALEGRLGGDSMTLSGSAPQWDVDGAITLVAGGKTTTGKLIGRIFVYDGGDAESDDLAVTLGGKTLVLRFRGMTAAPVTSGDSTTYEISGLYSFQGAGEFGLAERGDVSLTFRTGTASGSVAFDLRGHGS